MASLSLILNKFILYVLTGGEALRFLNTVFMSRVDLATDIHTRKVPGKLGTALLGQHSHWPTILEKGWGTKGAGEGVQLEMKVGRKPELPPADNPSLCPDNTPPHQTHPLPDNPSPT